MLEEIKIIDNVHKDSFVKIIDLSLRNNDFKEIIHSPLQEEEQIFLLRIKKKGKDFLRRQGVLPKNLFHEQEVFLKIEVCTIHMKTGSKQPNLLITFCLQKSGSDSLGDLIEVARYFILDIDNKSSLKLLETDKKDYLGISKKNLV